MPHTHPRRRSALARTRAMPAPARHGCSAGMVAGMAALPILGLPVVPQGQPFLLVLAILAAAALFGRATALSAAVVATAAGAALMLPTAGDTTHDAVRAGLSLVAFLIVAFGIAAAIESLRAVFAIMETGDARRLARVPVPAGRPGPMRLLMMTPEERRLSRRP